MPCFGTRVFMNAVLLETGGRFHGRGRGDPHLCCGAAALGGGCRHAVGVLLQGRRGDALRSFAGAPQVGSAAFGAEPGRLPKAVGRLDKDRGGRSGMHLQEPGGGVAAAVGVNSRNAVGFGAGRLHAEQGRCGRCLKATGAPGKGYRHVADGGKGGGLSGANGAVAAEVHLRRGKGADHLAQRLGAAPLIGDGDGIERRSGDRGSADARGRSAGIPGIGKGAAAALGQDLQGGLRARTGCTRALQQRNRPGVYLYGFGDNSGTGIAAGDGNGIGSRAGRRYGNGGGGLARTPPVRHPSGSDEGSALPGTKGAGRDLHSSRRRRFDTHRHGGAAAAALAVGHCKGIRGTGQRAYLGAGGVGLVAPGEVVGARAALGRTIQENRRALA